MSLSTNKKKCSNCIRQFSEQNSELTFWTLSSCNHCLCASCFTHQFALVNLTNKKCPKCRESPESIIHTTFKYHGRGSNRRLRREDNAISLKNEEEDDYLTLHLHDELPMIMCLNPDHHDADDIESDEEVKKILILLFKKLKRVVSGESNSS